MKMKPEEKKTFLVIGGLTYITGVALVIFSKWVRVSSEVGEQRHPAEHWIRITHTLMTYVVVTVFGYLIAEHVLPGLRSKKKKRVISGLGNIGFFCILTFSALVILYGSDGIFSNAMSWTHTIVGLSAPFFILIHSSRRTAKF